jgi:hypothetical protein
VGTESFFACPTGATLGAAFGAARVVADGRVVVGREDEDSDVRGAALATGASTAERDSGRFAAVVPGAAMPDFRSVVVVVVLPGDALGVAGEARVVLRAAGFLLSSPDVIEAMSVSASEAMDFEANAVLLAALPAAGRVGGLLKLAPDVLVRAIELAGAFDALVGVRAVDVDAAGRRAPVAVIPGGRRGGAFSDLEAAPGAVEDMLARADAVLGLEARLELFELVCRRSGGASAVDDASPVSASLPLGGSSVDSAPDMTLMTARWSRTCAAISVTYHYDYVWDVVLDSKCKWPPDKTLEDGEIVSGSCCPRRIGSRSCPRRVGMPGRSIRRDRGRLAILASASLSSPLMAAHVGGWPCLHQVLMTCYCTALTLPHSCR